MSWLESAYCVVVGIIDWLDAPYTCSSNAVAIVRTQTATSGTGPKMKIKTAPAPIFCALMGISMTAYATLTTLYVQTNTFTTSAHVPNNRVVLSIIPAPYRLCPCIIEYIHYISCATHFRYNGVHATLIGPFV